MIKQLGYEGPVEKQIGEVRDEELRYIWRRKVLGLGVWLVTIMCVSARGWWPSGAHAVRSIPMLHVVLTYAIFVSERARLGDFG
jgi:hypothetical protein